MSQESSAVEPLTDLVAEWFERVQEAQTHYSHAVDHHMRLVEELQQCLTEDVDGSWAVTKAYRAAALAINEVVRCQDILVDLVLRKDMPPPNADDEKLLI